MKNAFRILLADDDRDDRFFFDKALKTLSFPTKFETVDDGEKLMEYLRKNSGKLPDVLFLDLNMPRKNGAECLAEIKADKALKDLPVIIYSTSMHEDVADVLYKNKAHYYMRKTNILELQALLERILPMMEENQFARPPRSKFVLHIQEVV